MADVQPEREGEGEVLPVRDPLGVAEPLVVMLGLRLGLRVPPALLLPRGEREREMVAEGQGLALRLTAALREREGVTVPVGDTLEEGESVAARLAAGEADTLPDVLGEPEAVRDTLTLRLLLALRLPLPLLLAQALRLRESVGLRDCVGLGVAVPRERSPTPSMYWQQCVVVVAGSAARAASDTSASPALPDTVCTPPALAVAPVAHSVTGTPTLGASCAAASVAR